MNTLFWTYIVAITLLTITPGVDTVLVIRNASRGGWRDGAFTSLGICCGLFIHATISAVGISVILLQSAWAFRTLKLAGACYLIWLGAISLKKAAARSTVLSHTPLSKPQPYRPTRSLVEGFFCNVLNPKAVVFYMAFLPQFIDPAGSALRQSLFLAAIHFVIAMIWQCAIAGMVERARAWLQKTMIRRGMDGLTGAIMLCFGIKLALDR